MHHAIELLLPLQYSSQFQQNHHAAPQVSGSIARENLLPRDPTGPPTTHDRDAATFQRGSEQRSFCCSSQTPGQARARSRKSIR